MYDSDAHSVQSLSRKGSTISSQAIDTGAAQLCPALLQGGQCNPELCGPNAPCLQYVNDEVPPIEECVPDPSRRDIVMDDSENQAIDFTTPSTSPQRPRQVLQTVSIDANVNPQMVHSGALDARDGKVQVRGRQSSNKPTGSTKDESTVVKPNKRSRQRGKYALSLLDSVNQAPSDAQ